MTPLAHHNYELGVPQKGTYVEVINSDRDIYGGSNQYNGARLFTYDGKRHNQEQYIKMLIAPLSVTILKLEK